MLREEDRPVALPNSQGIDQQGCGAGSGNGQLVNDPKYAVDAKPLLGSDSAEQTVARQQDPSVSQCGNKTEAVVCRKCTVLLPECEGMLYLGGCQVMGDHAVFVEALPLPLGEVEDFRRADGQWDHESVRQFGEDFQQPPFSEVDQARSVIANDTRHWIAGPLICRSTVSRDSLRRAAARTGEISSSPTARQTSRLKRWGFSNAANP